MQPNLPLPRTWSELAFFAVALFLAFVLGRNAPAWVQLYLGRKKPSIEIHESQTRIDLNLATAESLRLQSRRTGFELIDDMIIDIASTGLKLSALEGKLRSRDGVIADQRLELEEKDRRIAELLAELRAYEGQKELRLAERALERYGTGSGNNPT